MPASASLPTISVQQIVERIFVFRQISRTDQRLLMSTFLSQETLSEAEHLLINRVFDALKQGLLKVVD
ncbi:hypothetical protein H6F50_22820 [Coleofasciculus sp. FACHB-712]|jgi:hypothetical protein|uniref:hypothetical protein n=1 Tax=Cyanophyceae TaxID=3028117 RepID=UPI001685BF63|nr:MULTISPECIES: hypothetical protein [unclassified Coleofasciculus]MBD1898251.1 hypothetical protein [Coleofasciculus sp. FACHB-129]MBD1945147.1 hypothetical protein [Coleofasciculus sp. FACHB-712]MBD2084256.1 hypothetical protein [Coleofasciculus sp. FACHB-542]MBD2537809.1 hypothetical protein [Coleofasciculus sp. FACHB-SPT36]